MSETRTVIVTGAGSGIGEATATRFARDGFNVVINGRTMDKLEKVAGDLKGHSVTIAQGDVSKQDDAKAVVAKALEAYGRVDILVNNAGIAVPGPIDQVEPDDWQKVMSVNPGGTYLMIREALSEIEKTKGNIVNVSSVSGMGGDWRMFAYNASKGAVTLLTKALALDLAEKGIRVNAVAPSFTKSEMSEGIQKNEKLLDKFADRIPMGRGAEAAEVADVIAFLASHHARFVNGVILPVDGGLSASNGQPRMGGA